MGFTSGARNFHNVSLGQGQETVAEMAMDTAAEEGHWVILQNVHLVQTWLPKLERKMEQLAENPRPDYRLFISGEPSPDPHEPVIPQACVFIFLTTFKNLHLQLQLNKQSSSGVYNLQNCYIT